MKRMMQFVYKNRPDPVGQKACFGLAWVVVWLTLAASAMARPVEFSFALPDSNGNPHSREVWATVHGPSGVLVRSPAFHLDGDRFCVRVRADEAGSYTLQAVEEARENGSMTLMPFEGLDATPAVVEVDGPARMPPVGIAPDDPQSFALRDGTPYVPSAATCPGRCMVGKQRNIIRSSAALSGCRIELGTSLDGALGAYES